ncbi:hypothetical protein [Natronospira sp.]|uniref:hypothetical protein n=1 Tax=Natronospira sp. TaxID=2024970 RepID=UPI0038733FE9
MSIDRPTEDPTWAEDPESLISEPENERARGWPFGYFPPADQKNWLQRAVGRWIDYLDRTGGGTFGEPAEAAEIMEPRATASIAVPPGVPLSRELDDLLDPLDVVDDSASTQSIGRVPVSDGRRVFITEIIEFSSPFRGRVAAFEVRDGEIQRADDTGIFGEDIAPTAIDTDGHSLAVITEAVGGDDRRTLSAYDADGDLEEPRWRYDHESEVEEFDASHVVCYGEWIAWVRMLDDTGSGTRFFVEGFAADQTGEVSEPDWSLEINAAGDLESTEEYVCSGIASNGEFLAVHIHGDSNNTTDVTNDSFVFLLDANGETPDIDVDQPDTVGIYEVASTTVGKPSMPHSDLRTVVWSGNRCYVGTRSDVRGIESFHFRHVPDYSDYSDLVKPTLDLYWRSDTFGPPEGAGGVQVFLSTDGEDLLFSSGADPASLHYRVLCDLRATVIGIQVGIDDPETAIRTQMVFEADPGDDWDERVDSFASIDGLYGWSVAGSIDEGSPGAPPKALRALSLGRQSRQMVRTDPTDRFNRPFHGVLIPTR